MTTENDDMSVVKDDQLHVENGADASLEVIATTASGRCGNSRG